MSVSTYHEDVRSFEIEAELAQASPRRVRFPMRQVATMWIALGAYALAALVAVRIGAHSLEMLWLGRCGSLHQAHLVSYDTEAPAQDEEAPATIVPNALADSADDMTGTLREKYVFAQDGRLHRGWTDVVDSVSGFTAAPAQAGTSALYAPQQSFTPVLIPVRAGWWMGRFVYGPVGMIPAPLQSATLLAAALLALALIVAGAWTRIRTWGRAFLLLRQGDALIATVRDKELKQGEVTRYFVTCGFVALSGQIIAIRERCTPEQWRALQIGDAVTVLHLPSRAGDVTAAVYCHLPGICAPRQFKSV